MGVCASERKEGKKARVARTREEGMRHPAYSVGGRISAKIRRAMTFVRWGRVA